VMILGYYGSGRIGGCRLWWIVVIGIASTCCTFIFLCFIRLPQPPYTIGYRSISGVAH
jgi:hypothetical protein